LRAFVTGATGFVGSHVAERLISRGIGVRALVRDTSDTRLLESMGAELYRGSLGGDESGDEELDLALGGVDVVVHNAAVVGDWGPWEEFERVGVRGTEQLLEACVRAEVRRFVHMSSASVYGFLRIRNRTVREDHSLAPHPWRWDHYGRAKIAAERVVDRFRDRISTTVLRPTIVVGARDRAVFPRVADLMSCGRLVVIGSGENPVHCLSAADVAEAAWLAATRPEADGQVYNLDGTGELTQRRFFETVAGLIGVAAPVRHLPVPVAFCLAYGAEVWGHIMGRETPPWLTRYLVALSAGDVDFTTDKAQRELGWRPQTPVWESLKRASESRAPTVEAAA
jgi:nucleoside-diphosphate-sugar epimerase